MMRRAVSLRAYSFLCTAPGPAHTVVDVTELANRMQRGPWSAFRPAAVVLRGAPALRPVARARALVSRARGYD
jgi:hypothetical protein